MNPWFHATGWDGLLRAEGNWGPVQVLWGTSTTSYLPDQNLDGPRVLKRVEDALPFYVVKGDGLCVTLTVTYPVPTSQAEEVMRRLVTGEGGMSARTRLKYYGQVVSFAHAHYFRNIPRWWEERQIVLLALVPVKVLQQALLLLWVPVWALLPPDPGGFIAAWLALAGIVLAVGVFLLKRAEGMRKSSRAACAEKPGGGRD